MSALAVSRALLWLLRLLNLATGVGLVLALVASVPFAGTFAAFFTKGPGTLDPGWMLPVLRLWMVVAMAMVAAVHVFLSRLLAVVDSVRAGDPFVAANALRLRTMAVCGLVIEALRLVFGLFAATMNAAGSNIDWQFSLTGWLAVALLFVLSQVFAEGARMRRDLDGMI
jgi:hypothetical protein